MLDITRTIDLKANSSLTKQSHLVLFDAGDCQPQRWIQRKCRRVNKPSLSPENPHHAFSDNSVRPLRNPDKFFESDRNSQ